MTQEQSDQGSLLHAASKGELEAVKTLIKSGSDPNVSNNLGQTPLHWAVAGDYADVASSLLNAGANPDARDNGGLAPLHVAARKDNLEIFNILLSAGADQDARDNNGLTPRDLVANGNYRGIANALLSPEPEANPQFTDNSGMTLRATSQERYEEVANVLTKTEINAQFANYAVQSPRNVTVLQKPQAGTDSALTIVSSKTIPTKSNKALIAEATISLMRESTLEHYQELRLKLGNDGMGDNRAAQLVNAKSNFDSQCSIAHRILYKAIFTGQTELVKALVQEGNLCNMDATIQEVPLVYLHFYCQMVHEKWSTNNDNGNILMSPIHCAALAGHVDIVNILIKAGGHSLIDSRLCCYGWSPLHYAARKGNTDVVKALIQAGASLDVKDHGQETPLYLALRYCHEEVASILIQLGADISEMPRPECRCP